MPATRFTSDHEWISYDDATSIGTIGITDYAQKALGDVVFVELPTVGTQIAAAGELAFPSSVTRRTAALVLGALETLKRKDKLTYPPRFSPQNKLAPSSP